MSACNPFSLDVATCAVALFDAIVAAAATWVFGLPVWGIAIVIAVVLGFAYRQFGIPGLVVAAGWIGFLLGRRPHGAEPMEHVPHGTPDAEPSYARKPVKRRTLADLFKGFGE